MSAVLDHHDDSGELLRARGWDRLAEGLLKQAADPQGCPNDVFALVVTGPRGTMRKFACNDKANTVLSSMYFQETSSQMPLEWRKLAAKNLIKACQWYGLVVPEYLRKAADVSGTEMAPFSSKPMADIEGAMAKSVGLKAVRITPDSLRKQATEGTMQLRYADPKNSRYPLDSLTDVMEAGKYMDKWASEIGPRERRAMALNIEKRAQELGIPVAKSVQDLTQVKVASVPSIQGHLEVRQTYYGAGTEAAKMFQILQTKVAGLKPGVLAETIASLDETYGGSQDWGRTIADPWSVVFTKRAEDGSDYSYDLGNRILPGSEIIRLGRLGLDLVANRFGKEFALEFSRDPIGFFKHLPDPEKRVMANLTTEQYGAGAPRAATM